MSTLDEVFVYNFSLISKDAGFASSDGRSLFFSSITNGDFMLVTSTLDCFFFHWLPQEDPPTPGERLKLTSLEIGILIGGGGVMALALVILFSILCYKRFDSRTGYVALNN